MVDKSIIPTVFLQELSSPSSTRHARISVDIASDALNDVTELLGLKQYTNVTVRCTLQEPQSGTFCKLGTSKSGTWINDWSLEDKSSCSCSYCTKCNRPCACGDVPGRSCYYVL